MWKPSGPSFQGMLSFTAPNSSRPFHNKVLDSTVFHLSALMTSSTLHCLLQPSTQGNIFLNVPVRRNLLHDSGAIGTVSSCKWQFDNQCNVLNICNVASSFIWRHNIIMYDSLLRYLLRYLKRKNKKEREVDWVTSHKRQMKNSVSDRPVRWNIFILFSAT